MNVKHGLTHHPLYATYRNMISRCTDINHKYYKDYGGRGIKVCDKWTGDNGLQSFINDIGVKPSANFSLDRIDNNGDYEPSNCRWADSIQQANNKRKVKFKTGANSGIFFDARWNKWAVTIGVEGKKVWLGRFKTVELAKEARLQAEKKYSHLYT